MARSKVLIVEDDRSLVDVLSYNLQQAGYEVMTALDGQDGLNKAKVNLPDILILDLMLPVIDGHEVCRQLRADSTTRNMLIIMLTAKSEEMDEVIGFSVGADDYVTKPYSVKVLMERMKALQRRRKSEDASQEDVISSHGVSIDRSRHRVQINSNPVQLTITEFRLLETLIRQPGRVFHRSELIDSALGDEAIVLERTIDVHIRSLRKKMEDYASLIETVRGVGYRFKDSRTTAT